MSASKKKNVLKNLIAWLIENQLHKTSISIKQEKFEELAVQWSESTPVHGRQAIGF